MATKEFAVAALAAAATLFAAPAFSQDMARAPMTTFFISFPIDATSRKEQEMNFGLQFQGMKPYQNVKVDYQTFKFLPAALAAMEIKYIVAGAVAVGAAVAVSKKDSNKSASFAQAQAQQAEQCAQTVQTC
jgi:hypothetical protein